MRNKNELIDYIDGNTFLSDNIAYRITPKLDLERIENGSSEEKNLKEKMERFKQMNKYVVTNNKIYNDSLTTLIRQEFTFTRVEELTLQFMGVKQMNAEQMFDAALKRAAVKQYENARLICKWCLTTSPNYTDVRLILGRTYAWEDNYEAARKQFEESVKRSPLNGEAWRAYIDNELYFDHYEKAIELAERAYELIPKSDYTDRIKAAKDALKKLKKGNNS
jgi:tetratricopeptide (TPR) repeat protein